MATVAPPAAPLDNTVATEYLTALLNKSLRVHITDGRMFIGNLRCTDRERNLVLATTYEHRPPSTQAIQRAAQTATGPSLKLDMERRFVGLIVVPGEHITRIELD